MWLEDSRNAIWLEPGGSITAQFTTAVILNYPENTTMLIPLVTIINENCRGNVNCLSELSGISLKEIMEREFFDCLSITLEEEFTLDVRRFADETFQLSVSDRNTEDSHRSCPVWTGCQCGSTAIFDDIWTITILSLPILTKW